MAYTGRALQYGCGACRIASLGNSLYTGITNCRTMIVHPNPKHAAAIHTGPCAPQQQDHRHSPSLMVDIDLHSTSDEGVNVSPHGQKVEQRRHAFRLWLSRRTGSSQQHDGGALQVCALCQVQLTFQNTRTSICTPVPLAWGMSPEHQRDARASCTRPVSSFRVCRAVLPLSGSTRSSDERPRRVPRKAPRQGHAIPRPTPARHRPHGAAAKR